jgi:hypothetical protein
MVLLLARTARRDLRHHEGAECARTDKNRIRDDFGPGQVVRDEYPQLVGDACFCEKNNFCPSSQTASGTLT